MADGLQHEKEEQREIEQLRSELHAHNRKYYVEAKPEISDREFDQLLERLIELELKHPEWPIRIHLRSV